MTPRIKLFLLGAVAILIGVLAVPSKKSRSKGVVHTTVPEPSGAPTEPADPGQPQNSSQDSATLTEMIQAQQTRMGQLQWGRDPFWAGLAKALGHEVPVEDPQLNETDPDPSATTEAATVGPQLSGISSDDESNFAIIDHEIVSQGQRLPSGFVVEAINPRSVVLRQAGETIVLVLGN